MTETGKVPYTAKVHTTGGRDGGASRRASAPPIVEPGRLAHG